MPWYDHISVLPMTIPEREARMAELEVALGPDFRARFEAAVSAFTGREQPPPDYKYLSPILDPFGKR